MSYKLIAKNSFWLVSGRVIALLISFFSIAMIARVYGPERFGLLNLSISIVALCVPVIQLGLNSIVTRDLVKGERSPGEILGTVMCVRAISTGFCFAFALLAIYMNVGADKTLMVYIAIMLFSELLKVGFVYSHWFEARSMGGSIAMCTMLVAVITGLIRVASAWFGVDFIWVVASYVVEGALYSCVFFLLFNKCQYDSLRYSFSASLLAYYVKRSMPLIASSLTAVIYMKIDQVMIAYFLDSRAVGVYAAASKISEVWYFIPMMIATAAFPVILKAKEGSEIQYNKYMQEIYSYLALIGYAAIFGATFFGPIFIRNVFGQEYVGAASILTLHIWGGLFMSMRALASKWILAEDVLIYSLITQGAGAFVNVLLNLLFIPHWGGLGAAAATVLSCAMAGYLSFFIFRRTRIVGKMMTIALMSPVLLPRSIIANRLLTHKI